MQDIQEQQHRVVCPSIQRPWIPWGEVLEAPSPTRDGDVFDALQVAFSTAQSLAAWRGQDPSVREGQGGYFQRQTTPRAIVDSSHLKLPLDSDRWSARVVESTSFSSPLRNQHPLPTERNLDPGFYDME